MIRIAILALVALSTSPASGQNLLLREDFEAYAPGTLANQLPGWIAQWNAVGNPGFAVDGAVARSGSRSMRIAGAPGGCWSGNLDAAIPFTPVTYVRASIRAGGTGGGGCHQNDVSIYLVNRQALTWGAYVCGVSIENLGLTIWTGNSGFGFNGTPYARTILEPYAQAQRRWMDVEFVTDYANGEVSFWIDGMFEGTLPLPPGAQRIQYAEFGMGSGDGTGWVDDVMLRAGYRATLVPGAPPVLGTSVPLAFESSSDPSKLYAIILSGGSTPPVPLADGRRFDLRPDGLFDYSLTPNNILLAGHQGRLDPNGRATATLSVPAIPALSGFTLHAGGVVLDFGASGLVRTFSPSIALTLR